MFDKSFVHGHLHTAWWRTLFHKDPKEVFLSRLKDEQHEADNRVRTVSVSSQAMELHEYARFCAFRLSPPCSSCRFMLGSLRIYGDVLTCAMPPGREPPLQLLQECIWHLCLPEWASAHTKTFSAYPAVAGVRLAPLLARMGFCTRKDIQCLFSYCKKWGFLAFPSCQNGFLHTQKHSWSLQDSLE